MLVSGRPAYTVQFTLRVGDGMVELGPDAAESAQAQPFYFAEDLWSGVVVGDASLYAAVIAAALCGAF